MLLLESFKVSNKMVHGLQANLEIAKILHQINTNIRLLSGKNFRKIAQTIFKWFKKDCFYSFKLGPNV